MNSAAPVPAERAARGWRPGGARRHAVGGGTRLCRRTGRPHGSPEPADLGGKGLTLYAGYQFGGSFTDANTGQSIDLREGGSYALSLDFPLDAYSEFQIFYGHQSTEFTPWPYAPTSA